MSCVWSRIPHRRTHLVTTPLRLPQTVSFSVSMTLTVQRSPGQGFCRMALNLDLYDVFSWSPSWASVFWEEDRQVNATSSHHIKGTCGQQDSSSGSPALLMAARHLPCTPSPPSTLQSLQGSHRFVQRALKRVRSYVPPPWGHSS